MILKLLGGLAAVIVVMGAAEAKAQAQSPDEAIYIENQRALLNSLHPVFGDVAVPGAQATLHLGGAYYFLDAKEARRVLVEGWGNPDDAADEVLGMIFPAGKTYLDESWGAVVSFVPEGHVAEEAFDAKDFERVAKALRDAEGEINEQRKTLNAEPIHFVGWATTPSYDPVRRSAVWAREIRFGDETPHALNYDIRALGRRGSLSLNVVSTMDRLPEIRTAATALEGTVTFDPGARYEDFDPAVDKAAGYGVAGMVAAGAGVLLAKKLGLMAFLLVFLKKGVALLVVGLSLAANWLRGMFGSKKKPKAVSGPLALEPEAPEAAKDQA